MYKILFLFGIFANVHGQVLKRVIVPNHTEYLIDLFNAIVRRVDEQGWWNLQLPEVENHYNEMILTWHLEGNVKYTNPFVASIQHITVLSSSLRQDWTWTAAEGPTVKLQGQLKLQDLAIGFDIISDLTDGAKRHTGLVTYPEATYNVIILRNAETHKMNVAVTGTLTLTNIKPLILPKDKLADALAMLFNSISFRPGVADWGATVFQPIAEEITKNDIVKFPALCYDCDTPK